MDTRVEELLKQLTLEEKIEFAACLEDRFANAKRVGLEGFYTCDNTNPYNSMYDMQAAPWEVRKQLKGFFGTCFPQMAALGNTWDEALTYEVADAQGQEAKYGNVGVLLRPGVNMKRSPLCGRNFEYFSEDPVLAGELAGSYIRGVQKNKVAACLKHYAVNSQEYERMSTDARVSERALHEIYLRPFQIAIEKGDPWTVMTSYNKVNGTYAHANRELLDVLRRDFRFDGVVMSDCMAVHYDKMQAHAAGLDVELDMSYIHRNQIRDALNDGSFLEKQLDDIVRRVLTLYFKINDQAQIPDEIDLQAHHALALRAAEAAAVLLKNNGILPLDPKTAGTVAVIGAYAKQPQYMGGGSGHMTGRQIDCAYDALEALVGKDRLLYAPAYHISGRDGEPGELPSEDQLLEEAAAAARRADVTLVFTGYDFPHESEGYDRPDYLLPAAHRRVLEKVLQQSDRVILIVSTGAAVQLTEYAQRAAAILYTGLSGEAEGKAAVNVLFGLAEPGGRLSETFPRRIEDTPAYLNYPQFPDPAQQVVYGEDIFIGYRWYDARKIEPLYPFGYGLSYTSFRYDALRLDKTACLPDDTVTVRVDVTNTGERAGSDVVQLYLRNRDTKLCLPRKQLKAFAKVELQPGETKTVELQLSRRALEVYSANLHKWVVEQGCYEILIGRSSREILLQAELCVSSGEKPYGISAFGSGTWVVTDERFEEACRGILPEETQQYFKNSNLASMCMSLPWDRLAEVDLGQGKITREQLNAIVEKLAW